MKRVLAGFVVLSFSLAARTDAECIQCPPGTLPVTDDAGDNSGWCVSVSLPGNVVLDVADVDLAGDTATLNITKTFAGPPGIGYVFSPILMDFFQVCDDANTVGTIVIDSEAITNSTTSAWTGFDWILFDDPSGAAAWFDVPASSGYDVMPFGSAAFSQFLDPGPDTMALRLTAGDGAIQDEGGFDPGVAGGDLVIQTDVSLRTTPVSFALKERPAFTPQLGDINLDGDVDTSDFSTFTLCFGGAGRVASSNCPPDVNADFDGDGDVDLADFAVLSQNFTGAR